MPAANMLTHDYEAGRLYLECGTPLTLQSLRCAVQDALKLAMDYQRDIGAWEDGWILSRKEPRIAVRMLDVRVLQPLRDVMDEYHGETSSEGSTRLRQIGSGSERDTRSVGTLKSDKGSDKGSESHHSERGEHGTSERGESSTTPTLPSQQKEDEKDASSGSSVERPKHSVLLARQSQERHREGHSMTDNSQQNSPKIEHRKEAKTKSTNDTHNNRSRRVDKGKPLQHPRVDSLRSREVLLDALELMTMYFHKLCASDDFVPNARTRDIIWRLLKALKGMPGCSNYSTPDRAVRRRLFEAGRAIWSCMYPNSKCIPKIAGITIREGFFTFTSWTTFVATCIFFGVPFVTHDVVTRPGNDRRMAWDTLGWTILVAFLLSVAVSVTRFVRHKMNLLRLRKEVTLVADDVLFKELYDYLYIKERVRRSLRFQVMTHTWPFLGMEGGTVRKLLIKKILDGRDFAFQLMAAAVAVLVCSESYILPSKTVQRSVRSSHLINIFFLFLKCLVCDD